MKKHNWVAQDKDGEIRIYENRPNVYENSSWWGKSRNISNVVAVTNRRNPKWKDSLIDLSKNDYIIKDGILMATRKHAALIHAWADGAEIQAKNKDGWVNICGTPAWFPDTEYRIKPKTRTVKFRNYINLDDRGIGVSDGLLPPNVKWLGDWQEVEIEL